MKKVLVIVLSLIICGGLAGCGSSGDFDSATNSHEYLANLTYEVPETWKELSLVSSEETKYYAKGDTEPYQTIFIARYYDYDLDLEKEQNFSWVDCIMDGELDTAYFKEDVLLMDITIGGIQGKYAENVTTISGAGYDAIKILFNLNANEAYEFSLLTQGDQDSVDDFEKVIETIEKL